MIATSPIERALAFCGGSHALADIEAAVATGAMQRWDGDESAIITEIRETPRQRILLFFLAGGQMAELRAMAPPIMDWGLVDERMTVRDEDAFRATRDLARLEGIFAGISSGTALFAALEIARRVRRGSIVTLLPDRGEKYLSTPVFPKGPDP